MGLLSVSLAAPFDAKNMSTVSKLMTHCWQAASRTGVYTDWDELLVSPAGPYYTNWKSANEFISREPIGYLKCLIYLALFKDSTKLVPMWSM